MSARRVLFGLSLLVVLPCPVLAAGAVTPAYRSAAGSRASYDFTAIVKSNMTADRKAPVAVRGDARMKAEVQYLGTGAGGVLRLQAKIASGTVTSQAKGKRKSGKAPASTWSYQVTPSGALKYRKATAGTPVVLPGLLTFAPDDAFLAGGAAVLPGKPVRVGDTWQGDVSLPDYHGHPAKGNVNIRYSSKVERTTAYQGRACLQIRTQFTQTTGGQVQLKGEGTLTDHGTARGTVTWLFDPAAGALVKADGSAQLDDTMVLTSKRRGKHTQRNHAALETHAKLVSATTAKRK